MDTTDRKALKALRKQLDDMIEAYEFMIDGFNEGMFDSAVETDAEKNRAVSIYRLCLQDVREASVLLEKVE